MGNVTNSEGKKNSVIQKIFNISSQDLYIEKTGYNDFHKYNYATEKDVVTAIRAKLKEQKLVFHFSVLSSEQIHDDVIRVTYEFTLVDIETGDTFACTVIGDGQDKGDKGPYKAFTGAQKYFFMKLFLIATGDDPESTGSQGNSEKSGKVAKLSNSRFTRNQKPVVKEEVATDDEEDSEDEAQDSESEEGDADEVVAAAERKVSRFSRGNTATAEDSEETTLKSSRRFKPGQRFK